MVAKKKVGKRVSGRSLIGGHLILRWSSLLVCEGFALLQRTRREPGARGLALVERGAAYEQLHFCYGGMDA